MIAQGAMAFNSRRSPNIYPYCVPQILVTLIWSHSNDIIESERVCPFWEKSCCPATFYSYRQMLAHCRQKHPDKPPFGGDPTRELVIMDNQGRVLSWEEVSRLLDHPAFWYRPKGIVLPREEVA
jgi:hypothetical protein